MKIMLAVDGSPYTKKMLAYLATHEGLLGAQSDYTVFTVQPPWPLSARGALDKELIDSQQALDAHKVLDPVCKYLARHGIAADPQWKTGPVAKTIAKVAQSGKFDLLVMGSHGHGALANLVMGSVSTQVLALCKVPLLIVR